MKMSLKYKLMLQGAKCIRLQKIMQQPYEKNIRLFGADKAVPNIPKLSDPQLDVEVMHVLGHPVLWVKHKQPCQSACLYLIGGGMLKYPTPAQAKEMLVLAKRLNRDMLLPYYPLCPKHTLPDVYDMIFELYELMLERYSAANIAFLGASSGGNLALGMVSHINKNKLPVPEKIYVSSPGTLYINEAQRQAALALDSRDIIMSAAATEEIWKGMTKDKEVPDYM
jgi:acetyl esterase/lipase